MATEASVTEQPAERHVEEATQPKVAEVEAQGEGQTRMDNLSTTVAPITGSEDMIDEDNEEITTDEVKMEDVKRTPDDFLKKMEASKEVLSNEKPEESQAVSESYRAREITEAPKENRISNEFRKDGTEGEGAEVIKAEEGAVLVSDIPMGPMETNPKIDSNSTVEVKDVQPNASFVSPGQNIVEAGEGAILAAKVPGGPTATVPKADKNKEGDEEPIKQEEGASPALEEVFKEVLHNATFAAAAQIIEEEAGETPVMEKEEASKVDEVSATEEKKDDTVRDVRAEKEKSTTPESRDEASEEERIDSITASERALPETADESSKEERVNSVVDSGETGNKEVKKPEQTLPYEVSNDETVNAVADSGENVKEEKKSETTDKASKEETTNLVTDFAENEKEAEKKSETADVSSKEEAFNPVMGAVKNENEEIKEPSVEKTVTSVTDSGKNTKQEQTNQALPPQEDNKEIAEMKRVDQAPKEEIPPAKQSKQSNNLISKMKHSMGKVKKAILGKSPSSKSRSTEEKSEINVE